MAKIKQGILGAFSGRVAGVVGSSWKGIAVMKSLPASVANPKTAAQQAQRNKFSQTVAFGKLMLSSTIKPLWDRFAQQMSGFNAWIAANMAAFDADGLNNYMLVKISQGKMAMVEDAAGTATGGELTVAVTWTDDSGHGYKQATDEAYVVCWNEDREQMAVAAAEATREDEAVTVTFADGNGAGERIRSWIAFRRADGTVVSETAPFTVTVASP